MATLTDAQALALQLLRQPDAAYHAMGPADRQALHVRLSSGLAPQMPPPGSAPAPVPAVLAVAAPAKVPADQASKVSLLVAAQYSGQRGWEVNWGQNLLLVATNLATGTVSVGNGKQLDRTRPQAASRLGAEPDGRQKSARMVALEQRDLAAVVGPLRGPARYAVTALYFDWHSNTALVDLAGAPGSTAEAAVPRNASVARVAPVSNIKPDTPLGVAVSAPTQAAPGAALPVRVIAKLPLGAAGLQPGNLLPVTALLVQRDRAETPRADLAVVATVVGDGAQRQAHALFEFDLRAAAEDPLPPGDYLLYVVAGGVLSSPRPVSLR